MLCYNCTFTLMKIAERYFVRGNSKIIHKDYSGAIKFFDKGIQSNPEYAWAYLNRGIAKNFSQENEVKPFNLSKGYLSNVVEAEGLTHTGLVSDTGHPHATVSLTDFDNAIRINPMFAKAYFSRAMVKSGFHSRARMSADFSKPKDENLGNLDHHHHKAEKMNSWNQDYAGFMTDFDKAIEIDPGFAEAYYVRGLAKNFSHYHSDTVDDLTKVKEIELNLTGALIMHGLSIDNQVKDYGGAISDFDKAIEINPEFADAYYCRGLVKNHLKNPLTRIISTDQSGEINSESSLISEEDDRKTESSSKDYEEIIADFDRAIKINPRHAKAYCSRGLAKIFSQDLCEVMSVLAVNNETGSAGPENRPKRKFDKIYKLSNYAGAIADFDSAIKINPRFANAYFLRGIIKVYCHDHRGAKADFDKAIELDHSFAEVFDKSGFSKSLLRPKERGYLN